ncbi:MAG: hypothetical protein K2G14_05005 [Ruminococcus sp.]|nr:hypothetical protein [Ruminococcus sp.]
MIYYVILTFVFIIFIMDVFVVITLNVHNAGKFIRRLRYWVYSINPSMYVIMILLVIVISKCFHAYDLLTIILVLMLMLGCCIAYAEKFFTRKKVKKSDKKRVRAEKRAFCVKSGYAEEITPLTEKKG